VQELQGLMQKELQVVGQHLLYSSQHVTKKPPSIKSLMKYPLVIKHHCTLCCLENDGSSNGAA
tara:strand:+ start:935 stop:1123 length:189 start_codon:yes stop_codon:yes gene_type:complete